MASENRRAGEYRLRDAAVLGAMIGFWLASVGLAAYALHLHIFGGGIGMDAHAYWRAGHGAHPYIAPPGWGDAYLYSPLFIQVIHPLTLLPWHLFCGVWMVIESVTFLWLLQPLPWRWRVPSLAFVVPEVLVGNIVGLVALAVVLGVRRPGAWSFPALTKVWPAAPGALWFAARRDWTGLARCALWTAALAGISFAAAPGLWRDWFRFLAANRGSQPLTLIGFPLAVLVTLFAARRNLVWLLPVAVYLALPKNSLDPHALTVLAAIPRMLMTSDVGDASARDLTRKRGALHPLRRLANHQSVGAA